MSLHKISKKIPDYIKDLQQNFNDIFINMSLSLNKEELFSVATCCCYALKNPDMLNAFKYEAGLHVDEKLIKSLRSASIMISRNATFYRFTSGVSSEHINSALIELEETSLSSTNVDKELLMMCFLGVSIINNCTYCSNYYANRLLKRGVAEDALLDIARVAAVLCAVSNALEIETIRNYNFM